ncbi:cell envelope biogenesis protein OmpA [Rhodobacteraceae bacterium CCMM004]|nr:cell envelope biogenesis protein OmpA [Rhodobacteraceae bacterium CCMM004]
MAGLLPGGGAAEEVTLTARGGGLSVTGEIVDYDGEFYRIDSPYGVVTLDAATVICSGAACPGDGPPAVDLTVSGSAHLVDALMPPLVETFAARQNLGLSRRSTDAGFVYVLTDRDGGAAVARFAFRPVTADEGFADLLAGVADIVLSDRAVTADEVALAEAAGLGDLSAPVRSRVLALDALVPVVSLASDRTTITLAALRDALRGEGAAPLHLPAENGGLEQALRRRLLGGAAPAAAQRHETPAQVSAAVAEAPGALGITRFTDLGEAEPLSLSGPCGIAVAATRQTIKTEDYPLTLPLFAYVPARRLPPIARTFLRYTSSPAAQPVIRRAGFVDQFPEIVPVGDQGARLVDAMLSAGGEVGLADLRRMAARLRGTARLTLTYRFEDGSSVLDAQSRSNIGRLAEAIRRGVFDGRRLIFVGFSDGVGSAATNLRLSRRRAETVRAAVAAEARMAGDAPVTLDTDAFGEALPMACDDTAWGRGVNRRVEIWLE